MKCNTLGNRSGLTPAETASVRFSSKASFFFFLSLRWAECVSTFTLGMFALKACCQKAGGGEVEALLAEVLLPAAMNGSFRGECTVAGRATPYPPRERR